MVIHNICKVRVGADDTLHSIPIYGNTSCMQGKGRCRGHLHLKLRVMDARFIVEEQPGIHVIGVGPLKCIIYDHI